MSRRANLVLLIVALTMSLAGSMAVTRVQAADSIKIGLLTDQSGALKQYGTEQEQGFMLGLQYATNGKMEVAGKKIEVLKRDNAGKPDVAASQARELIEKEGVDIFYGAPSSGVAVQLQQVAKDADVILMAGPAASPDITGKNFNVNTFRVCRNTFQDYLAFAAYAKEKVGTKFITLAADYEFGRSSAAAQEAVLKPLGITFVQPTIFAPQNATDFTPYIQQILASGADVVSVIWAGDSSIRLFQQLDELGVKKKMAIVTGTNSNPILKASPPSTVGAIGWIVYHYTLPKTKVNDWLVENNKKTYNTPPDLFTECSFATAQAVVAALDKTKGDTSSKALIPALEGLTFDGPKGTYTIRKEDHQALVPMYIIKIANLTDPDYKFVELLAEIPADKTTPPCLAPGRCPQTATAAATQAK